MQAADEPADSLVGQQLSSAQMWIKCLWCCRCKERSISDVKMKSPALGKNPQTRLQGLSRSAMAFGGKFSDRFSFLFIQPLGIWLGLWNTFFSWLPCCHPLLIFLPGHWPFPFQLTLSVDPILFKFKSQQILSNIFLKQISSLSFSVHPYSHALVPARSPRHQAARAST